MQNIKQEPKPSFKKVLYQWITDINVLVNKYIFNNFLYFLLTWGKFGESYSYLQNQLIYSIYFTYLILICKLSITRKWPTPLSGLWLSKFKVHSSGNQKRKIISSLEPHSHRKRLLSIVQSYSLSRESLSPFLNTSR